MSGEFVRSVQMLAVVLAGACLVLAGAAWLRARTTRVRLAVAVISALVFGAVLWARPAPLALSNAAVLAAAAGLAPLLARSLGSPGGIVAFTITASAVDVLSFGGGLTRQIIRDYQAGGDGLLRFLAVTVPVGGRSTPVVGVVDLLILGALFLGLIRIHGRRRRAGLILLTALAVAVVTGIVIGGVAAVPFLGFAAAADAWLAVRGRSAATQQPAPCT